MDFEQLRTFLEVARHKSFSRAGEKLSLTQPAISAQIRSLETEVGAQLFDRSGGKVTFTAAGRVFEPFAEHCLECHQHILLAVGEMQRMPRGEVSISANESTCLYVLPQVFTQFKQQYSRVGLNIIRADRSRTLEAVQNREVDFGVIALPVKDPRLTAEWIHKDELVLAAAPGHALAKADRLRMEDIARYPILLPKQGRQREQIDLLFSIRELKPNIGMELDSSELLKRFVAAGMGIGFVPRSGLVADEQGGTLKVLPIEGVRLQRELALVFRKDKSLSRAAQAFLEIATGRPRLTRNSTAAPKTLEKFPAKPAAKTK
ncbi:Cys regulon transcriptional activator CysB [Acidisarcina polymorpha]|uniref:Cys regulon transcriptional activator CysB n=1 Tax=Acidisarcina polymorpha TaxID=2211140 RepID=A0A2Z5FX90_9BACT|nr:LysR family transcriptional regulator [Acidisarcina polymorpha]AXC11107.1 Cys regulon transcriptional activator CysB [Acidisarcina polymorpha]